MRPPGLDLEHLRALRTPPARVAEIPPRIRAHLQAHDGYLAYSGGKDSTVALHLALQADPNIPVVFFDSGLEYPETYTYLATIQEHFGIKIDWIRARRTTLQLLAESGHWDHAAMQTPGRSPDLHRILITEPAAEAHRRHGPGEIWGVRSEESHGRRIRYRLALSAEISDRCTPGCCGGGLDRARHHGGLIRRADGTVAYGPIWDWTTDQVWTYLAHHQVPINPVYAKLRELGAPEHFLRISHMLDAQRLHQGRVTWLRRGWPDMFEDLVTVLPRLREYL